MRNVLWLQSQQADWKPARKKRARLTLKHCWFCHKGTDSRVCPTCGRQTMPNSQIKRFPRTDKALDKALRASRKPNEDLWVKRPWQGGLCSPA